MTKRMKPEERKAEILEAALRATRKCGFASVRIQDIAIEAGCGYGTVSLYFNTMLQMRRAVMRAAIKREDLAILAQGLGIRDATARKAPQDMKEKAVKTLLG